MAKPGEFRRDMQDSASDFVNLVWPVLGPQIGGGELQAVENIDGPIAGLIDKYSGIDAFQFVNKNGCMRGIASRIQWMSGAPEKIKKRGELAVQRYLRRNQSKNVHEAWASMTPRVSRRSGNRTEIEKRTHAASHPDEGWIFPALQVQSYIDWRECDAGPGQERTLLYFCLVRSLPLYQWIDKNWDTLKHKVIVNASDGVRFLPTWVRDLEAAGIKVLTHEGSNLKKLRHESKPTHPEPALWPECAAYL